LQVLIQKVTAGLNDYDAMNPAKAVETFVDGLANWYIRRSRRRFWKSEDDADKQAAYATLYECLVTLSKLLAPFMPFLTEAMYQNLVRSVEASPDTLQKLGCIGAKAPESVHHCTWPQADLARIDEELIADTRLVREVVSLGRAARQKAKMKVRQPLPQVLVRVKTPAERAALERLSDQVLDELNVKSLTFVSDDSELISYQVKPAFSLLGPKYGKLVPAIKAALEKMDPAVVARKVLGGGHVAVPLDGETLHLEPHEVEVRTIEKPGYATAEEEGYLVGVDIAVTPELEREGLARELVRHIQEARKNAGFRIADRIVTGYQASPKVAEAFAAYSSYIQQETLSVALQPGPLADAYTEHVDIEGEAVTLHLRRQS
jgi:isoleucyl-tRNA synthetase